jgi:ATP-dependent DNA helicase DinG
MKEKVTLAEAFEILQSKYGLSPRDRQIALSEYYSAPLYFLGEDKANLERETEENPVKTTAVAEGGTGIGKTLGYLTPIVLAKKGRLDEALVPERLQDLGRMSRLIEENVGRELAGDPPIKGEISKPWQPSRIVVSTSSKLLQGQLLEKDLKLLKDFMKNEFGDDLTFVKVEGVGNYICQAKVEEFLQKEINPDSLISKDGANLIRLAKKLSENGAQSIEEARDLLEDKKDLHILDTMADEGNVFTPPDSFSKCNLCKLPCAYQKMMMETYMADVVVANHHWTAYRLIKPGILDWKKKTGEAPEEEEETKPRSGRAKRAPMGHYWLDSSFLVIDEAHQFEEAILKSMSRDVRPGTLAKRIGRFIEDVHEMFVFKKDDTELMGLFEAYVQSLEQVKEKIEGVIKTMIEAYKEEKEVDKNVWADVLPVLVGTSNLAHDLSKQIGDVSERSDVPLTTSEMRLVLSWQNDSAIKYINSKVSGLIGILKTALDPAREKFNVFDHSPSSISISPISVGPMLSRWPQWNKVPKIFTSATIATSVSGSHEPFKYFVKRVGVHPDRIVSVIAASPFNYKENAFVLIPSDLPDPAKDKEAWLEYQKQGILRSALMTGGGALVLFTSRHQMREAFEAVKDDLKKAGLKPAMQGMASAAKLRSLLHEKPNAVVFGLDSFWQGLDVPGDNLRNLMIMRLPFDSPSDPFIKANVEYEKAKIAHRAPHLPEQAVSGIVFGSLQVPRAVLFFRQGFGRLIRSEEDKGIVTLFDPRVVTKKYGEKFLAALPPDIPIVQKWEVAERMAEELGIKRNEEKVRRKVLAPAVGL